MTTVADIPLFRSNPLSEQWTRAGTGALAMPMANKIPSGKKVLGYSLGTFLIAFPAMILVYRMMS